MSTIKWVIQILTQWGNVLYMSCINNEALSVCSRNEIKSKTERESRISFVCYKSAFSVCVHSCAMCSVFGLKWANGVRKVYS